MDPFALIGLLPVAVVAVLAAVVVVFVRTWLTAKRRREAIAMWAMANGLRYAAADPSLCSRFEFDLFDKGDGRGADNVVTGTWQGTDVTLADYWYYDRSSDGNGRSSRTYHRFSVAVLPLGAVVPGVCISRENALSRLADHVGFRDIEFESEEFNRRFDIRADDREFAFKLIDARMIDWLLHAPGRHCYEVRGPWLLAYTSQLPAAEVPTLVAVAKAFVERVPRLVWEDYGKGSP